MIWFLTATLFFILLQAFFSGIETGLVSLRRPRVQNEVRKGEKKAMILEFFLERPSLMLSALLLGTNICTVCASLMAKKTATAMGFSDKTGLLVTSAILGIILLGAEIIPKDWFRQAPYDRCSFFAPMLRLAYIILWVPAWMLARFTDIAVRLFSRDKQNQDASILLREDFRLFLRESEEGGIIDTNDANILDKAVDFYKFTVGDIMVPCDKVNSLSSHCSIADAVEQCRDTYHSRMPVRSRGKDGKPGIWLGTFSIYDAIYKIPENDWEKTGIMACIRPLNIIHSDSELGEVIVRAKTGRSPLLTVVSKKDPSTPLGVVTSLDVVNYLFRR